MTNSSTGEVELHTTGAVRSKGAELDLTGRVTDQLDATLTYAYTDAKVTEDESGLEGNRLNNVAKNTASLALAYNYGELYNGNLRFGISGNYVGKRAGIRKIPLTCLTIPLPMLLSVMTRPLPSKQLRSNLI